MIQFRKKSTFACDVIKKRRLCPSIVPGKEIKDIFGEVGGKDSIQGTVDDFIYN